MFIFSRNCNEAKKTTPRSDMRVGQFNFGKETKVHLRMTHWEEEYCWFHMPLQVTLPTHTEEEKIVSQLV